MPAATAPLAEKPVTNGNGNSSNNEVTNDASQSPVAPASQEPSIQSILQTPTETPTEPKADPISGAPKQDAHPTESTPLSQSPAPAAKESVPEPPRESLSQPAADVQMKDSEPEPTPTPVAEAPRPKSPTPVKEAAVSVDEKMEDAPAEPTHDATVQPTEPKKEEESKPVSDAAAPLLTSEVDLQPASMSQLALETQPEPEEPSVLASVEVTMDDAPSSTKVAREREDDETEERAAKRARTESDEDRPAADEPTATEQKPETPAESSIIASTEALTPSSTAPTGVPHDLTTLTQWNDNTATLRGVSPYQRREIRKIISRIKKTKGGANFKDSVIKLWPALAEAYSAKITKPMDLSELDRNLRDEKPYDTYGKFQDELKLIYENAFNFNGPIHDVTTAAFNAVKAVWEEALAIPFQEPAKPKPVPKAKPVRESRAVATAEPTSRRQSAGPGTSPALDDAKSQDSAGRRGSTDGDRPKRTVRAPKPKDIDYTTKPSRKKLKPELQFGAEVLTELMSPKHERLNMWFLEPVDAEGLNIPNYYSVIKKPMDLGKVSRMLAAGEITSFKDLDKNIRLVFENCYTFNGPIDQGNPVSLTAKELENVYNNSLKGKDAWLAKNAQKNTSANASDEEEEEEDEEVDETVAVDNSKEIAELNAKLQEETKKLHAMFVPGANQSMIDIQKGIVDMVQQALMKAVAAASEAPAKPEKKKKGGRAKGTGGRKSTGGAPAKKAAAPKKAAGKKNLTAADKDAIANAINDLDYPHLDKAIDIIKKDTGQNENTDGELELDIDQLSNPALLKLWDLCKSVLPGFGKNSAPEPPSPEAPKPAPKAQQAKTTAGKPKKNKPMSAQEQESRIAQLMALRQMYKDGQDGEGSSGLGMSPPAGGLGDVSSDDSDSEEE